MMPRHEEAAFISRRCRLKGGDLRDLNPLADNLSCGLQRIYKHESSAHLRAGSGRQPSRRPVQSEESRGTVAGAREPERR